MNSQWTVVFLLTSKKSEKSISHLYFIMASNIADPIRNWFRFNPLSFERSKPTKFTNDVIHKIIPFQCTQDRREPMETLHWSCSLCVSEAVIHTHCSVLRRHLPPSQPICSIHANQAQDTKTGPISLCVCEEVLKCLTVHCPIKTNNKQMKKLSPKQSWLMHFRCNRTQPKSQKEIRHVVDLHEQQWFRNDWEMQSIGWRLIIRQNHRWVDWLKLLKGKCYLETTQ